MGQCSCRATRIRTGETTNFAAELSAPSEKSLCASSQIALLCLAFWNDVYLQESGDAPMHCCLSCGGEIDSYIIWHNNRFHPLVTSLHADQVWPVLNWKAKMAL